MTDKVSPDEIEAIVGMKRHRWFHYGRAVSETGMFYILHSEQCKDLFPDLRDCPFSEALDNGIENPVEDVPLWLLITDGELNWQLEFERT